MGWEWELAKSVVGPFLGAGLAFASNAYFQRTKLEEENVVAGNLALHSLASKLLDLYTLRASARKETAARWNSGGPAPDWALARRMHVTFSATEPIDFKALGFLLKIQKGREVLLRVRLLETKYQDLQAIAKMCWDSVHETQKRLSEMTAEKPEGTWHDVERHMGPELVARLTDEFHGVLVRVHGDVDFYVATVNGFRDVLMEQFGQRIWNLSSDPMEGCRMEELPGLPPSLAAVVHKATTPQATEPDGGRRMSTKPHAH